MRHLLALLFLCACDAGSGCDGRHVATPAPPPPETSDEVQMPEAPAADIPEGLEPPGVATKKTTATTSKPRSSSSSGTPSPRQTSGAASTGAASKTTDTARPTEPAPVPAQPVPAPTPDSTTPKRSVLPKTANVRFEIPSALHDLVDKDGRMLPWLKRILPVIDGCYRSSAQGRSGVVKVGLTMHENRRPSTAIQSLPGSLASLVPCATTKLMNQRPPLFTGPEGARYTVGIRFTP